MNFTRRHAVALALGSLLSLPRFASARGMQGALRKCCVGMLRAGREKGDATHPAPAMHLAQRLGRPCGTAHRRQRGGPGQEPGGRRNRPRAAAPLGLRAGPPRPRRAVRLDHPAPGHAGMLRDDPHAPGFGAERHRRPPGAQGPWPPGRRVALGDKGSTSGDRIPFHEFGKRGIDLDKRSARVLDTRHQAIQPQVPAGRRDACADFHRNRGVMMGQGLISAARSKVIWLSAPRPDDAFAVSAAPARACMGPGPRRRRKRCRGRPSRPFVGRWPEALITFLPTRLPCVSTTSR